MKRKASAQPGAVEATAEEKDSGSRLDRFLAARVPDLSRTRLKQLILAGEVRVKQRVVSDPDHRMKTGDRIEVRVPPPLPARPKGQKIPLTIVHEDDALIVVDKPAGLVVHPAPGNEDGTLVNALIAHCGDSLSGIGGEKRPGIVHRLDKDTSGLLVVAKTDKAHKSLAAQFADHGKTGPLVRGYLGLVWGVPDPRRGKIDAPIARDPKSPERMVVLPGGRHAVTRYELLDRFAGKDGLPIVSLIECRLETGRTHQIRVHLTRAGHPLLGDPVYGASFRTKETQLTPGALKVFKGFKRQALHAYLLGFAHPATGKKIEFESRFPPDLSRLHDALKTS